MGFQSVYRTLQELFPQVDARLLKAAAIEHSDDPDASVEFILTEVLPYTTEQAGASTFTARSLPKLSSVENGRLSVPRLAHSTCASSPDLGSTSFVGKASNGSGKMNELFHVEPEGLIGKTLEFDTEIGEINETCHVDPLCMNGTVNGSLQLTLSGGMDTGYQSSGSTRKVADGKGRMNGTFNVDTPCTKETISSLDPTVSDSKDTFDHLTRTEIFEPSNSSVEDAVAAQDMSFKNIIVSHTSEEVCSDDYISNFASESNVPNGSTAADGKFDLPQASFSSLVSSSVLEHSPLSSILNDSILDDSQKEHLKFDGGLLCGCSVESVENNLISFDDKISEEHEASNDAFSQDIQLLDSANIDDSSSMHSVLTRSGQLCRTGLLEDIVEDSKTHKKTMFSAMESVLKLMKEVEHEEEMAQKAKEEAAKGGFEIHAKVEELKRMLNRAREANDMHSGEVYGERAILSTEMRELQSRLLVLSDEKDHSLSMLNMMQQDLETRLASAEAERIEAEKEKSEKEESARRSLVEQELIMEKVVQESKILQQEAEENAKLREFLVDRGHVVDSLQGEISVICDDVKLLKEKYDAKVPLSECLSSKQTSCILASSGSSLKSNVSEKAEAEEEDHHQQQQQQQPSWPSSNQSFPMQVSESDQDESVEEGWELF